MFSLSEIIHLKIDRDIEELIPGYLKNRRTDVDKISKAIDQGDFETARMLAHSMKGNGKSYGFKEISNLGSLIEKSALDEKPDAIQQALEKLLDYLNRIQITYE